MSYKAILKNYLIMAVLLLVLVAGQVSAEPNLLGHWNFDDGTPSGYDDKGKGVAISAKATEHCELETVTHKLDILTPELMADMNVPGVSISLIYDGQIAWHKGYGVVRAGEPDKVTPETVFEACSMSKVVFTYAVLKLVEQAKLDLDRPLAEYLDEPYLEDEPLHKLITARMVMTHTTGFPNWRKGKPLNVKFKPGTKYGYSGEGYLYLQKVVEHITGKTLNAFMKEVLLEPLGMTSSSYVWQESYEKTASAGHDKAGLVKPDRRLYHKGNAAFSLYCTSDDYAKFILEVMKDDRSAVYSLSRESIKEMLRPTIDIKSLGGKQISRPGQSSSESVYRGLGWVINKTNSGIVVWHTGSNGTGFRCISEFNPQQGNGIVVMTGSVNGKSLYKKLIPAINFL